MLHAAADDRPRATTRCDAAELALGTLRGGALAIAVGHSHVLAVARARARLLRRRARPARAPRRAGRGLAREPAAGGADAAHVGRAARDPRGRRRRGRGRGSRRPARLRQRRRRAAARRGGRARLARSASPRRPAARPARVRGRARRAARRPPPRRVALVAREGQPGARGRRPRLAISVIEDITEIKQAEEAQRFLAESSRALARSLELEETLPEVAGWSRRRWPTLRIHLLEDGELRLMGASRGRVAARLEEVARADAATVGRAAGDAGGADPRARRHRRHDHAAQPRTSASPTSRSPRISGCASARRSTTRASTARARRSPTRSSSRCCRPSCRRSRASRPPRSTAPAGEGNEVGGDFYDVFSTGEREWFAVMGDVCGKGAAGRGGDRAGALHDPRRGRCATAPPRASCAG